MKKILFLLILLIPFIVYAEYDESKITIESFNVAYVEGYGRDIGSSSINGKDVNLSFNVSDVGDKVIYNMVVKNDSSEDVELYNRFDNSDYIEYTLMSPDLDYVVKKNSSKTFQLEVEYVSQVSSSSFVNGVVNDNYVYSLEVSNELGEPDVHAIGDYPDTVDNPNTKAVKDVLIIVCIIFVISLGLFLLIRRKNRLGKVFIFIGIIGIITPIIVYAYKQFVISFKINVIIKEPVVVYPEGQNMENVDEGEIVKIGDEEFYVIGHEDEDLVLLAKYNLAVGKYKTTNGSGSLIYANVNYGLQNSEAVGVIDSNNGYYYGVLPFSSTNYWHNNSNYSGSYEEPNYPYVYDYNSNAYQYVENYKSYLESLGANIKEARLLKYSEAIELGCNDEEETCSDAPSYLTSTTFWLGNVKYPMLVWVIGTNKYFNGEANVTNLTYGIRPVIVLSKKKITYENNSYPVCKKATELHTGYCKRTSNGCYGSTTVTFGTLVNGTPKVGDAYDCDVNNDKVYDPILERFYYIGNEDNNSKLLYSRDVVSSNYNDDNNINYLGPVTAYLKIPSISEWSNPGLISPGTRQITNENGGTTSNNGSSNLPLFDYTGRAGRLLTVQEVNSACNADLKNCVFLFDNLDLYLYSEGKNEAFWLENPSSSSQFLINAISSLGGFTTNLCMATYTYNCTAYYGVRPVITIKSSDLEQ